MLVPSFHVLLSDKKIPLLQLYNDFGQVKTYELRALVQDILCGLGENNSVECMYQNAEGRGRLSPSCELLTYIASYNMHMIPNPTESKYSVP